MDIYHEQDVLKRNAELEKELAAKNRELEIEAGLEKVRVKTMAMHSSDDVVSAIATLFTELDKLGIENQRCGIAILHENKTMEVWSVTTVTGGKTVKSVGIFNTDTHNFWRLIFEGWINKDDFFYYFLEGEDKEKYFNILRNTPNYLPQATLEFPDMHAQVYYFDEGAIWAFSLHPHSENTKLLMKRFTTVFSHTFRRYQDLQKAEALAREAQIQLALERVRARTMAMQKSDELPQAANLLFQQVQSLGMPAWSAGYCIWEEDKKAITLWMSSEGVIQPALRMPLTEDPSLKHFREAHQRGESFFVEEVGGEALKEHYAYLRTLPGVKETLDDIEKAGFPVPTFQIFHLVYFSKGFLLFITYEPVPEAHDIFKRFGNVFDQTYTRFLDLQKAEAQAREAKIEAALEKVRSRTMAMQRSEELAEVATVLFQQVKALGVPQWTCGFSIFEIDDKEFTWYPGSADGDILSPSKIPLTEHPVFISFIESKKRGDELYVYEKTGEVQADHYRYMLSLPVLGEFLQNMLNAGFQFPTFQIDHIANFSHGNLVFITYEHFPEMHDIFKRFAKVFEQTYTRFLDLQKAEAQAREAKIEAALERTRTHSMLMRQSNELDITSRVFHEQLLLLGIDSEFSYVWLPDVEKEKHLFWATWNEEQNGSTILQSKSATYDLDRTEPYTAECFRAWESEEPVHIYPVASTQVKGFFDLWSEIMGDAKKLKPEFFPEGLYYDEAFMKYGCFGIVIRRLLTDDEKKILLRFTIEFERTYTRFLDLQKAEAQAREAMIEAALERVRSRAMAMHKTDELLEAAELIYKELSALGIASMNVSYAFVDEKEKYGSYYSVNPVDGKTLPFPFVFPHTETEVMLSLLSSWKKQEPFQILELDEEVTMKHQTWIGEHIQKQIAKNNPEIPFTVDAFLAISPKKAMIYNFNFAQGYIFIIGSTRLTTDQEQMVLRFTKVFELTYRRFLDLKQAEAQAREAQIELALERVRARTMAMHSSEDVGAATSTMFTELEKLGVENFRGGILNIRKDQTMEVWSVNALDDGRIIRAVGIFNMTTHPLWWQLFKGWENKDEFLYYSMAGKEKEDYIRILNARPDYLPNGIDWLPDCHVQSYFFGEGAVWTYSLQPHSEEDKQVMKRFASVFSLTFRRYQDLMKAEAQSKEAQIELGLERVRARAMAMQNSDELKELIGTVFTELTKLDLVLTRCVIMIYNGEANDTRWWMANSEDPENPMGFYIKPHNHPPIAAYFKAWKERQLKWTYALEGQVKKDWDVFLFNETELKTLPDFVIEGMKAPDRVYLNASFNNFGNLTLASLAPLSDEHFDILLRFAKVFDHTYTRFNDLKQAEAQAREAKIEAALERVRAKAMAMHRTEDLNTAVATVFEELDKLNLGMARCGIGILDKEKRSADVWTTSAADHGNTLNVSGDESIDIHPLLQGAFDAWLKQTDFSYVLAGKDLTRYYQAVGKTNIQLPDSQIILSGDEETRQYYYIATFQAGGLFAFRDTPFPDEAKKVMKRFADVFNLTYTRFLDLQKAEAQAREAKIEASLERVRGKAMAMHSSEDLAETIKVFNRQMELLGVKPRRCGVGLIDKDVQVADIFTMNINEQGEIKEMTGKLKLSGHPVLEKVYENWLLQKEYHPVLKGNEIRNYYKLVGSQISFLDYPDDAVQFGYFFFFTEGAVYAWTEKEFTEHELKIYRRFTTVLSLTYKRYKDLKNAEARAQVAIREASLDRVRAEIASMRTADDLQRITPLVWRELTALGLPFFRCGVFIINEKEKKVHIYLSTPEGKSLAVLHLDFTSSDTTANAVEHWRNQKVYSEHWGREQFTAWVQSMIGQGQIKTANTYQAGDEPPESLTLQFVPFKQGMMYVGSAEALSEKQIEVVQALADAFSVAYSRYEDFTKLEAAKEQVENTLKELRSTQTQLIQSEKMASLGELTAGIAHEIQNPLNFVNNFSDVSNELLEEMKEELATGNAQEAIAIAEDVRQNLEKILHHGKRADAIVKGMLQHSRTSSGQKELTDINALAEEYLRLAYHGLRAKDKSFNATTKTDFDDSIGKINVIPQDIGRVILNLINNAFYAVSEKKKAPPHPEGGIKKLQTEYEPTVIVKTSRNPPLEGRGAEVVISVIDNGNGIPQKVLDKIFQPFFTTKPTGQGTGLGLSLSYDIITKGHRGEINVSTKENDGTEFTVILPV